MSIVAVVGDATTTTALALAAGWPGIAEPVIVEADSTGGSLAAWLGTPATPSLSTIVANGASLGSSPSTAWFAVDAMVRRSDSGIRFIAAPVRAREARRAIGEANLSLFPLLADLHDPAIVADVGSITAIDTPPPILSLASTIVVCHRQDAASAGAATVRLERLGETVESLLALGPPVVVALIGHRPFAADEISCYLESTIHHRVEIHLLPVDDLTAAVFAGRTGVSERRLARLPLIRDAAALARRLAPANDTGEHSWIPHRQATT